MPYQGHALSVFDEPEGTARLVSETNGLPVKTTAGVPLLTELGTGINLDAWGIQKVCFPVSIFHGMWTFDIPASMWFMYENGTQVYTSTNIISENGAAKLTTDATNTDLILESRECPRYQPNRGHLFSTALIAPNKDNDGTREWGICTAENGVCFRLKSDGLLYAVIESNGVETEYLLDTSSISGFDVEKGHLYDIQFQWRGVGNYFFYIDQQLVYTVENLGIVTALTIENPALPIRYEISRNTQDVSLIIGCADITSENGILNNTEQYGSVYAEGVSTQNNSPIIVAHNPLQINGVTNTRTVTLARISFNCSKKAVFKVWMTRNPAGITGETLQTVGNGSYMQTDSPDMVAGAVRASSVNTSNMRFITTVAVEALTRIEVDNPYRNRIEFPIVRGDYLVITGTAASGSSDVVIEWGEQI